MKKQTFSRFYRKSISERLAALEQDAIVSRADADAFQNGKHILAPRGADRMIENVIGVFGLPLGLGVHFLINGRDYAVPMVVEEPSIVAAVSSAAKLVRSAGGFQAESGDPIAIGQVVVERVANPAAAVKSVAERKDEILNLANSLHSKLVARGGGARDIDATVPEGLGENADTLVIHLLIDTRDAMGANLVNSMCEGVAELIEDITGGRVLLRIVSNLCDRSIVRAKAVIPASALGRNCFTGDEVRDRIVSADRFANIDRYRAATHNKGIMNGIDAVAIATGNDWRAIEAAAHAYAAKDGRYRSLTRWETDASGQLVGNIALPLNVGIVGGNLQSNPAVKPALRLLKINSSRELAEVMAAVGLAQNLAALRALVTDGIQKGHMKLHARSVAHAAGADTGMADEVVDRLIESGDIKVWKAREIVDTLEQKPKVSPIVHSKETHRQSSSPMASAAGKIILLGEHAVLHGSRALAAPLPLAVHARILKDKAGIRLVVPPWHIDKTWAPNTLHRDSILRAIDTILLRLGITRPGIRIELFPQVPRAMGLGSSAAAAVAVIRALSDFYGLSLTDSNVNRIAFESERIIHGQSSGLDNTVACYETPLLYRANHPPEMTPISVASPIPFVVGMSSKESLTAPMVAQVREAWGRDKKRFSDLFQRIDMQVGNALDAIKHNDLDRLGQLMNDNQRLLKALKVSTPELDDMIRTARLHGAVGAKLTGGGGGGAVIALCPEKTSAVADGLHAQGWKTFSIEIDPDDDRQTSRSSPDDSGDPAEQLIVVDDNDRMTGLCTREQCHAGDGIRHRAFSIFIFNRMGHLLLQKRSNEKALWPLYWSNSCCSHPRAGESMSKAVHRRLIEELGISTPLTYVFKFPYQARYDHNGSENELCSVFIGQTDQPVHVDPQEVDAWRYVSIQKLDAEMSATPERFTPWFKMEWERLRRHPLVLAFQQKTALTG